MKCVLITGASRGLGLALKHQYEHQGYIAYNISRSSSDYPCDFTSQESIINCVAQIQQHIPCIDIIINCIGGGDIRAINKVDWNTANQEWQTNVLGHALFISELRELIIRSQTDIITIGATIGYKANEYMPLYSVTKRGLRGLVENRRAGLKSTKSRVILISPGGLDTQSNIGPHGRETIISQQTNKPLVTMIPTKELAEYVYHTSNLPKSMEVSEAIINRK